MIAALAELRGKFRLDLFGAAGEDPGLDEQVEQTLQLVEPHARAPTRRSSQLAYGEKRRLEIGLALATVAQPAAARRAARRHEPAASASRRCSC